MTKLPLIIIIILLAAALALVVYVGILRTAARGLTNKIEKIEDEINRLEKVNAELFTSFAESQLQLSQERKKLSGIEQRIGKIKNEKIDTNDLPGLADNFRRLE